MCYTWKVLHKVEGSVGLVVSKTDDPICLSNYKLLQLKSRLKSWENMGLNLCIPHVSCQKTATQPLPYHKAET